MNNNMECKKRRKERGNVLFLILIAVALFAALSYAVTSSTRGGGGDAGEETNLVQSSAITQYPSSIRTSIIRMIVNGVDPRTLLFDGPENFGTGSGQVGESTGQDIRAVFHPEGGAAPKGTAPADVMSGTAQGIWRFSSDYQITNIGTNSTSGSAANDLIAFLPNVSGAVCRKINEELGIAMSGTDADGDGVTEVAATDIPGAAEEMTLDNPGFGSYDANKVIGGDFTGQPFGCYDALNSTSSSDGFVYYHVLVER